MGIDLSVAERCQKIQRLFGYLFLRSRYVIACFAFSGSQFFSQHLTNFFFELLCFHLG